MGMFDNLKAFYGGKTDKPNKPAAEDTRKVILILEDDQTLMAALTMKFQLAGFNVFQAGDGQKGLELISTQKPNIILLDLLMPIMDGRTFLKRLKELSGFSSTPVIILTNVGNLDNMAEMKLYNNVREFLIKANVTPDDIVEKVNQII
jgi:two-component system chemotaxis response regulator CheY